MRAVERQWIRRRSSPTSYSRRVRNSSPSTAGAWNCTANGDVLRSRPGAPGAGRRSWTRGQIGDLVDDAVGPGAARETERVGHAERDRPEREPAPTVRRHAVRGPRPLAAPQRRDEEPGRPAPAVEHVGQLDLRRVGRAGIVDLEVHARVAADVHAGRADRPFHPDRELAAPHPEPGDEEQAEGDHPEDRQLERPEQAPGDEQPGGRAGERPAPAGQGGARRLLHYSRPVAPGTATASRTSPSTSAGVRPRSSASGVSSSRCSSTTGATRFTSSGIA